MGEIERCSTIDCGPNGECIDGFCRCLTDGIVGQFCQINVNPCYYNDAGESEIYCQNNGICNNYSYESGDQWFKNVTCTCYEDHPDYGVFDTGFHGDRCEIENADPCDALSCSYACYFDTNVNDYACACPSGQYASVSECLDIPEPTTQAPTTQAPISINFSNSPIRDDNTIRPFADETKCFYHKMNGFTFEEKIYVSDCVSHDRYRWSYDDVTGQIMNWNRKWIVPHCMTIPEPEVTKKKQQLHLAPCEDGNEGQSWTVENGMLKVRSNPEVCVMWNLQDKT